MRLGVVLTGAGACAAASAGALTWLLDAGVSPCAVCGMQAAAWPAALYLAGYDAGETARRGCAGRADGPAASARRCVRLGGAGHEKATLRRGRRLEKLPAAQTGERALGLCERQGVFLCRTARSGHVVAFCTQSVSQEGTIVTLQASAGFAARAALARPPFVSALEWMGSPLLPLDDLPLWPAVCSPPWARSGCWSSRRRAPCAISRTRSNRRAASLCPARGNWEKTSAFFAFRCRKRSARFPSIGFSARHGRRPGGRRAWHGGGAGAHRHAAVTACCRFGEGSSHRAIHGGLLPFAADHGFQRGSVCPGGNTLPGVVSPVPIQAGDVSGRGARELSAGQTADELPLRVINADRDLRGTLIRASSTSSRRADASNSAFSALSVTLGSTAAGRTASSRSEQRITSLPVTAKT